MSQYQKIHILLEYLRKNTDVNHRVRQKDLRNDEKIEDIIGHKDTFASNIERISETLNMNEESSLKDKSEWELVYDGLLKDYGFEEFELEENDEYDDGNHRIGRIYYQHPFSYEEVNRLIEGVLFLDTVNTQESKHLIDKLMDRLTSKYYKQSHRMIHKVHKQSFHDTEELHKSLSVIRTAIQDQVQIEFMFQAYNREKKLVNNRNRRDLLCPYYIVANAGQYYLIGCCVTTRVEQPRMSIWRIDLMSDITIPERDASQNRKGRAVLPKHEVANLPAEWDEQFLVSHMNMSYDEPKTITLRIKSPKQEGNNKQSIRGDYTFLYDYFGEGFTYIETEKVPPYDDIVKVRCSPYGMVNWALQYSERVEVVAPEEVRQMVQDKIEKLREKYANNVHE